MYQFLVMRAWKVVFNAKKSNKIGNEKQRDSSSTCAGMYANRNVIWCHQCATNNVNQTHWWLKANNRELATRERAILPEGEYAIYVNVVISIGICIWMQADCSDTRALKTSVL